MKKEKLKGFICGVLMSTLIFSSGIIGFASTGAQQITAAYNNIKIYVNNKLVTPKDANGNTVEPFIYNGTTYLPVRAVGDALGQAVSWDNNTKSVYIGEQPSGSNSKEIPRNTVIYEKNDIKITYLGLSVNSYGEHTINVKIENNSSEDCGVQVKDLSVNGIMAHCTFSCKVASGKTAIDDIDISNSSIEKTGIPQDELSLKFIIFNPNTYVTKFESEQIEIIK